MRYSEGRDQSGGPERNQSSGSGHGNLPAVPRDSQDLFESPRRVRAITEMLAAGSYEQAASSAVQLSVLPNTLFRDFLARLDPIKWTCRSIALACDAMMDYPLDDLRPDERGRFSMLYALSQHIAFSENPENRETLRSELSSPSRSRRFSALVMLALGGPACAEHYAEDVEAAFKESIGVEKVLAGFCLDAMRCSISGHVRELLQLWAEAERDGREAVARSAEALLISICRDPEPETIDALIEALQGSALRRHAAAALGQCRRDGVFITKINDSIEDIRRAAESPSIYDADRSRLLGSMAPAALFPERYGCSDDQNLEEFGGIPICDSLPELVLLIADHDRQKRIAGWKMLKLLDRSPIRGVRSLLRNAEKAHGDPENKEAVQSLLNVLVHLAPESAAEVLTESLEKSPAAAGFALAALPYAGPWAASAVPLLTKMLKGAEPETARLICQVFQSAGESVSRHVDAILQHYPEPLTEPELTALADLFRESRGGMSDAVLGKLRKASNSPVPRTRRLALTLLAELMPEDGFIEVPQAAAQEAIKILSDHQAPCLARRAAARVLAESEEPDAACNALMDFLLKTRQELNRQSDGDKVDLAEAAIEALGRLGLQSEKAFEALSYLVPLFPPQGGTDEDSREPLHLVLWEALSASALCTAENKIIKLHERLRTSPMKNPAIAGSALFVLRHLHHADGIKAPDHELYIRCLGHPSPIVKMQAAKLVLALARPSGQFADNAARGASTEELARLNLTLQEYVPILIDIGRHDGDFEVRDCCHHALGVIAEPRQEVLDYLLFAWREYLDCAAIPISIASRLLSCRSTFGACYGLSEMMEREPAAEKELMQALCKGNSWVRRLVMLGQAHVSSFASSKPFLEIGLSDHASSVRQAAVRVLAEKGPEAAELLEQVLENETDEEITAAAQEALAELRGN